MLDSVFSCRHAISIPPLDDEALAQTGQDVTVIIPTLDGDSPAIRETVASVLANEPFEVLLVTIKENYGRALELAAALKSKKVRVFANEHANKRLQMLRGLVEVRTRLTTFSDDDVFWKPRTLAWMLAPFSDPLMGGTGTCQRLRRAPNPDVRQRLWNFLAALYLERRNFDCAACNAIDGGLPCLSGRTVTYRTDILQDAEFQWAFNHEEWRGQKLNAADDDNFLTRWMVSHGWKIKLQYNSECEVETTLEDNKKYLLQCLRWSRSNWRSNLTTLFVEGHVWRNHPWSTYSVFLTTLTAHALIWDAGLAYLLLRAIEGYTPQARSIAIGLSVTWWAMSRFVKLLGHFRRFPQDALLLPLSILFGYFHSLAIKPYALYTLDETTWGSRLNADVHDRFRMMRLPPYALVQEQQQQQQQQADDGCQDQHEHPHESSPPPQQQHHYISIPDTKPLLNISIDKGRNPWMRHAPPLLAAPA